MTLVEMIFKEDFLVAQAGNFESHCCILTRTEWIIARLVSTIYYISYDMGHMTWHEWLVPHHNKLGHIWHGSSCQKCKNTSWKPSVKPKYFVHEIKNQAEHLIFVPFGSPSRWFLGTLTISILIKLILNWGIRQEPAAAKFYSMVLSNGKPRSWCN